MTSKKKPSTPVDKPSRAAKKAAVLGTDKPKRNKPVLMLAGAALAALVAVGGYFMIPSRTPALADTAGVAASDDAVRFDLSLFDNGRARHFEHQDGDVTVRYFVLKSTDGVVRAAFDACDVCWPAGKGYYQEGDQMVCRNCGRRFASVRVNEVKGGCNPAPLERQVQGGQLVIQVADIVRGRTYFDFSQKG